MKEKFNQKVSNRYAEDRPEIYEVFPGDFINYGYWEAPDSGQPNNISVAERINSQQELYRKVLGTLNIDSGDRLLEVGCGRGAGACLALQEYSPLEVCGIDLVPEQIERAIAVNGEIIRDRPREISFRRGSAGNIPFSDNYFDKVFSVEAIQHFPDIDEFFSEVARVTKHNLSGLAITSVLAPSPAITTEQLGKLIDSFDGVCYAHSIDELTAKLKQYGFGSLNVTSIGENVFRGMASWFERIGFDTSERNCVLAYEQGLMDYFLISARREN